MSRRNRKPWAKDGTHMRSLEHYKRNPHRLPLGVRVRIWSEEHRAYWRPKACGYTGERTEAGEWVSQDAFAKTRHCGPEKRIWFEFVQPGDLGAEARHERHWHEDLGNVLWWKFPIEEPPYVGSPLDVDWPGYHTQALERERMTYQPPNGEEDYGGIAMDEAPRAPDVAPEPVAVAPTDEWWAQRWIDKATPGELAAMRRLLT